MGGVAAIGYEMAPPAYLGEDLRDLEYVFVGLASTLLHLRLIAAPIPTPLRVLLAWQQHSRPGTLPVVSLQSAAATPSKRNLPCAASRIVQLLIAGCANLRTGQHGEWSYEADIASSVAIAASKAAMISAWLRRRPSFQ